MKRTVSANGKGTKEEFTQSTGREVTISIIWRGNLTEVEKHNHVTHYES